jgi:hypothetical protein
MRRLTRVVFLVCVCGCSQRAPTPTPTLPPIVKISAKVYAVPGWFNEPIELVEVPQESVPAFAKLITPIEPCIQTIDSEMHHHVADITVQHPDGSDTTLIVRWTGHNPAAISLDGRNYYYGGSDDFPDGATRILQLLNEYHYQSHK